MPSTWWLVACAIASAGCVDDGGDLAGGVRITEVSFFQGPEVPLVRGGALVEERRAPILAGRPGRVVVTLQAADGAEERDVAVRLTIGDEASGDEVVLEEVIALGASATTGVEVGFAIEEGVLAPGSTFAAEVIEIDGFESALDVIDGARQPASGAWLLDVREAPRFRVVVVPVGLADVEARQPEAAQLERWRAALHAWLPVREVDLTVSDDVLETDLDLADPSGWGLLIDELAAWRAAAGLDADVFVYGILPLTPAPGSGIFGLASTIAVEVEYWRVAAGVLRPNDEEETTIVVHELGHLLGRSHAPCGNPGGPDHNYPYANASIGVPGVDLRDGGVRLPGQYFDFMSYCLPVFASDYQFGALWGSLTWLDDAGAAERWTVPPDPAVVLDRWPEVSP